MSHQAPASAPARHRGRTALTSRIDRAAITVLWAACATAVFAVTFDVRPVWLVLLILVALAVAAAALAGTRLADMGRRLDADVARLLHR